ncbi:hypothetical protein Q4534_23780 [Cyclobacterium sp. 1_MG-2023]|uniref:hypothetical protein n=1 Tax=Cyclobacterium sp. 1_MG-2023 TaxID=3062681 RepID=UPI0026E29911|nr:hypothetical protein [Cyclobacterium sp. 1_MG-2023]MDO6440466.1 hypothetical protein [Cyclobacterium sp. 1_MG-2023]
MNRILRIPKWLLFILLLIVPTTFPVSDLGNYIKVAFGLLVVIWMIKVNEEMYLRIKGKASIKFNLFAFGLIFAFIYFSAITLLTEGYNISTEKDNFSEYGNLVYVYLIGHLISLAGFFYALHFTAYSIHVLEEQLFGKHTEYTKLLIALFYFPIGIWWCRLPHK